ncbi:MAG: hypothetical protein FWE71_16890 [Nocardioidaceae bacterium]|nr:hypothetical protein [Nocardioidaceae bacterium]MCL2612405.1 hypothetical protein [Nocardioidaceae bacterium]
MAGGKRAGARQKRRFRPVLLGLAIAILACIAAWGYLVYRAIDFGADGRRDGAVSAWALLALASVGAVACLFLGLMLVVRLSRAVGITHTPAPRPKRDPGTPAGGKRAAR